MSDDMKALSREELVDGYGQLAALRPSNVNARREHAELRSELLRRLEAGERAEAQLDNANAILKYLHAEVARLCAASRKMLDGEAPDIITLDECMGRMQREIDKWKLEAEAASVACNALGEQTQRDEAEIEGLRAERDHHRQANEALRKRNAELEDAVRPLAEIGRELGTQDNKCTAHPIYRVMQRDRVYGVDPGYTDSFVWVDDCGQQVTLEDGEEPDSNWRRVGYKDRRVCVSPFLTAAAADSYILANKHRLEAPYVWVDSAYRNLEWQTIRETCKKLAALIDAARKKGGTE